ncbi:hypothetical protein [Streptomyces buecherae]|uniref:Uncharacterized protein n=1 Tax=Streptomyces buecherae TaxID=2763006 RepID=A0A7H8NHG5_9ACTN|nr:hypothetical protein [Streptomyces buecherae]QKW53935.1 hypothetical protein HUT08_35190 [Streptomyces buecherae]
MTERDSPHISAPRFVVLPVQPGSPPFRLVEVGGEVAGTARSVVDVIEIAQQLGVRHLDLEDPDVIRWVGGDQFTWTLQHLL